MESFPWWSEEQKQLAKDVRAFMQKIAKREMETRWTREFPFDLYEEFGKTGFTGAAFPKEYGGMGLGCTGGCIVAEEVHKVSPGLGRIIVGNMMGGVMQLLDFGTEDQKKKYLPRIAQGEIGCVGITEVTAGTDAAGIEVEAKPEGDHYVLNGKKRFIVGAGVAQHYIVYARSSNNPEDVKKHRHLTAFWVEKGVPGFTTERINEILGFENVQNGSLDFDNVIIPVENRIGQEGEGWKVLMHGLNFERTLISASAAAWQQILLQYTVPYSQRRVQFGRPTIDIAGNQTRIADIIMRLKTTRMSVYYTAYLWDLGKDITIEASMVKACGAENTFASSCDATQVMGGDGVNRFYPVQNVFEVAKTDYIAGGTLEACRLVIFRSGLKLMAEDMQMPRRVISEKLGVPVPAAGPVEKKLALSEENVLAVLGEDYRINQGLHMTLGDIEQYIDADDEALGKVIDALQEQGLVMTYRTRKGAVQLVKANYKGLKKAYPKEYYRWAPEFVTEDRMF
ncbi:Acyl-CoA dehydrogenase [Pelotomaculum schinkii]|uniref:Acyl-CoA dehydrogenase n=1 Tax=Pelotomaculum schinkii TaxID=78350 RepID=A0A4Y7R9K4_9FIRM|nr:acyl-CoA dehydrogenase family protein [Pelotomaculum schinkii]TEB05462.1 Acyl-CoA dehydrogenase [Pelotomaculum schinkii]